MDNTPVLPEQEARAAAVFQEAVTLLNRTLPAGYQVAIHLRRMGDTSWHGIDVVIWQTDDPEDRAET